MFLKKKATGIITYFEVIQLANVKLEFRDGHIEYENNCGTSVYNGNLYIWERGTRKGRKPRRVIPLSSLHSRKSTGRKGIYISR